MLLQVLDRDEDGCRVIQRLIREAHVTGHRKRELRRRGWQLFRALLQREIITPIEREANGRKLEVNLDLQADFSLHQSLSLFLVETLDHLDKSGSEYPLQLLTLVESILENPDAILFKQIDKLREERVRELKAEGVPYEERMEQLQEIEHPKPMRAFVYDTFNAYKEAHPWIEDDNIKPKSIAREIFEDYLSFTEYVQKYGLQRSEGVLLRHLSQVYKVLTQTVPEDEKTEEVWDIEDTLADIIRGTDSSLLDEWERLRDPDYEPGKGEAAAKARQEVPFTERKDAFERQVRLWVFDQLKAAQTGHAEAALDSALETYLAEEGGIRLDPEARNRQYTVFDRDSEDGAVLVSQVLVGREGPTDFTLTWRVDLDASREADAVMAELV
jgi:hypothetical protein